MIVQAMATYLGLAAVMLQRLVGPIVDKELRVASRRVRWYVLRAGYAAMLTSLVMVTWHSAMRMGSGAVLVSRMPEVAKVVTTAVTWLQFLAAQGLAVVLLSSAIGEEIRKGTLGVLLTTPITSVQIVLGKLLGRMLQVLVLLAISLPVLAILRLLGGVPWNYVLAGGSVTLAAALFAGSLSLWLSTHCRYGSRAISIVLLLFMVLFVIPPAILSGLSSMRLLSLGMKTRAAVASVIDLTSPFHVLSTLTADLWAPIRPAGAGVPWVGHCLLLLGLTVVLLALTIRWVRKAAAATMSGDRKSARVVVGRAIKRLLGNTEPVSVTAGPVKHVIGSPVVWKETRRGLVYGWSLSDIAICTIALAGAIVLSVLLGFVGSETHMAVGSFLAACLSILLLVRLVVECAGGVPREREARTWPILLTTLLEDREIVYGKVKAALLRNLPVLVTLAAIAFFLLVIAGSLELLLVVGWALVSLATWIVLVVGIGSYFGVVIKTRMSSVVATIAVCLALKYGIGWMFIPIAGAITMGFGGTAWAFIIAAVVPCAIYGTVGVVAIRIAVQRVRHDVF